MFEITVKDHQMLEEPAAAGLRNGPANELAAELAERAYQVALRHHAGDRWLDLQLELWRELSQVVDADQRRRRAAASSNGHASALIDWSPRMAPEASQYLARMPFAGAELNGAGNRFLALRPNGPMPGRASAAKALRALGIACFASGFAVMLAALGVWFLVRQPDGAPAERLAIFVGLWAPTLFVLADRFDRRATKAAKAARRGIRDSVPRYAALALGRR